METVVISDPVQVIMLNAVLAETIAAKEWFKPYTNEKVTTPGLYIVKDRGAYVMPASKRPARRKKPRVAYFDGFGPEITPLNWERCREIFGGDDFGSFMSLSRQLVLRLQAGDVVVGLKVKVTPEKFTAEWSFLNDTPSLAQG